MVSAAFVIVSIVDTSLRLIEDRFGAGHAHHDHVGAVVFWAAIVVYWLIAYRLFLIAMRTWRRGVRRRTRFRP